METRKLADGLARRLPDPIRQELQARIQAVIEKPGRDPRPEFKTATFHEGIERVADLQPGMVLEGVVTNVAAFGAFIDIGVHQDGLVHVSALSSRFVKDPHDVVKGGQVVKVKVKVVEVDLKRNRIALTTRLDDAARPAEARGGGKARTPQQPAPMGAMALALAKLKR